MKFEPNPGASNEILSGINPSFLKKLPADYVEFMKKANGGEGYVGEQYLMLWRIQDLEQDNEEYEVRLYVPNLIFFGSSGGGEAFGFLEVDGKTKIVQVPFIGMEPDLCEPVAESFSDFIGGWDR